MCRTWSLSAVGWHLGAHSVLKGWIVGVCVGGRGVGVSFGAAICKITGMRCLFCILKLEGILLMELNK